MNKPIKKTKIICTLGPASWSPDVIRELVRAGMDVARLNFSHGDHERHRQTIQHIRKISKEERKEIGILQDLQGPKIRLGELPEGKRTLHAQELVSLASADRPKDKSIPVVYPYLLDDVSEGDRILLADGTIELRVEKVSGEDISARVVVGGEIFPRKGVNLPSSNLRMQPFTEKDKNDLLFGLKEKVDFVALSFVSHENDLTPVREIIDAAESPPLLIAKMERPQAIERMSQIMDYVDGVMVARGDLGVEMPYSQIPMIQKNILLEATKRAIPSIVATQLLRSMVENPIPTRAEVSDIANAIQQGSNAVMLSEETAVGKYPVEAAQVVDRVARETELHLDGLEIQDRRSHDDLDPGWAVAKSACTLARSIQAAALVCFTMSGTTARLASRYRPEQPIIALTPNPHTQRQLALSWGVSADLIDSHTATDGMFKAAITWVKAHKLAKEGDHLVLIAGIPLSIQGKTNLIRVIEIE